MVGLWLLQTEQEELAELWVCVGVNCVYVCVCMHGKAVAVMCKAAVKSWAAS